MLNVVRYLVLHFFFRREIIVLCADHDSVYTRRLILVAIFQSYLALGVRPKISHFLALAANSGELEQQLGEALLNVAEFQESESWLQRAQQVSDRSSASSGLRTSMIHMDLGNLYRETQRFEDADRELAAALKEVLRWVPDSSQYAMRVRQAMGQLRVEQGRPQEASAILEDLLHVLASFPSDVDRYHSALIRYNLGVAYLDLAKLPQATDALTGALTRNEEVEGPHAPRTEIMRIALGNALTQQGQIAEAEALLRNVAAAGLPGLPKDHPFLGELRRAQGLLHRADRLSAHPRWP